MSDALFDAAEYGESTRRAEVPTPPRSTAATVAVIADDRWKLVSINDPGVVHALAHTRPKRGESRSIGALVSHCGITAVPRTFAPGEVVPGCKRCIDHGAPAVRA